MTNPEDDPAAKYEKAMAMLNLPPERIEALDAYAAMQHPSARDYRRNADMPDPPYPAQDNVMLHFIVERAMTAVRAGADPEVAILDVATHCWFEGALDQIDRLMTDLGKAPTA